MSSAFAHKIIAMLSSMLVTALVAREFGLDGLALFVLATQVASYAQLAELGIPTALSRRLPRAIADGDDDAVRRICTASMGILSIGSLLILLSIPVVSLGLPNLLVLSEEQRRIASLLFGIILAVTAVQLPLRIGFGVLASLHRFSTYFSIELVALIVKTGVALALLTLADPSLAVYLSATLLPITVAAAFEYVRARRALPVWNIRVSDISRGVLRELVSLSGAVMLGTFATAIILQGGGVALAFFVPPEKVATFSVPVILAVSLMAFAASASAFLSPIASQLTGRDDARLRAAVQLSARYSFALAALIWLGSVSFGPLVLTLWLGADVLTDDAHETMSSVLILASAGLALAVPGGTCRGALVAMGRHWQVALIELATAVIGLGAAVGLAASGLWPPVNCFVASLFASLVLRGALLVRIGFLAGLLDTGETVRDWGRVTLVLLTGLLTMAVAHAATRDASVWQETISALAALTLASLAFWFAVVTGPHRRMLLSRLHRTN
ncbi:hypothetical protein VSX64_16355 [Aurantimonas sp. C2-6-R+9]|uniref:hypothetical protein n=1 Tax=unclassified Aurantimonas TaxID=2638230 RepID=UPI002E17875D|nr:hypothetical protein [Aurantimonas sp. C2-6-R+9]